MEKEPKELEKSKSLGEEIIHKSKNLKTLLENKPKKEKLQRILKKIENIHAKLSKNLANSEDSVLERDWKELARKNQIELKDQILVLQKFLLSNESILRRNLVKKEYGLNFDEIISRIKEEKSLDDIVKIRLSETIEKTQEKELVEKVEDCHERLERISNWLLILNRLRLEGAENEG